MADKKTARETMTFEGIYPFLSPALHSLWIELAKIKKEMAEFVPHPQEFYQAERDKELARLRGVNTGLPDSELIAMADGKIISEDDQIHAIFFNRFMTAYASAVIASQVLCEAAINSLLAVGLAWNQSEDLFALIDRAELKAKWVGGPKLVNGDYDLPKGGAMYQTLAFLSKQRNALVHAKSTIHVNDKRVLKGSDLEIFGYERDFVWLERFLNLPYDLTEHYYKSCSDPPPFFSLLRGPIKRTFDA